MTSTTHTTSHLSNDQVKELCFIIHNAKTEEERNNAKWELVYSFKDNVKRTCQEYLKNIYGKNVDFESKNIYDLIDVCYDVLFEYTEKYNPEHSSGASLFTYARNEMKNKMLQATNPGMTETQIRNYNIIFNARKCYEKKYDTTWFETEESLLELSNICGLSIKVIKKTLALKRETSPYIVSFDTPLSGTEESENCTIAGIIVDERYNSDNKLKNQKACFIFQSLSLEETAILCTMVDINNNYKPISEREGVRRLEVMGFNIKRGTLNSRREALKKKVWSALYDTDYRYVA